MFVTCSLVFAFLNFVFIEYLFPGVFDIPVVLLRQILFDFGWVFDFGFEFGGVLVVVLLLICFGSCFG